MLYILAIAGIALSAISIGLQTWQTVEARKRQAEEFDAIEEEKENEAAAAQESAKFEEQQHRRRIQLLLGKQQAVTAAAGVSTLSQSAVGAEIDLVEQGELEALNLRRGGKLESNARLFEARLAKFRGATARGQIAYDIAGGVLGAASSATSIYSGYKYGQYYQRGRQRSVASTMTD